MAFCIITDSASDVPESVINEYELHVIPTPVTIEGTDYFDGDTIFPDQFYEIQASGKEIKTYHVSQFMFEEHFRLFAERGDEVLYMCFSTGIAGTFNAASLAYEEILEEYPEFKLIIIDTKCASVGDWWWKGCFVCRKMVHQRNLLLKRHTFSVNIWNMQLRLWSLIICLKAGDSPELPFWQVRCWTLNLSLLLTRMAP